MITNINTHRAFRLPYWKEAIYANVFVEDFRAPNKLMILMYPVRNQLHLLKQFSIMPMEKCKI